MKAKQSPNLPRYAQYSGALHMTGHDSVPVGKSPKAVLALLLVMCLVAVGGTEAPRQTVNVRELSFLHLEIKVSATNIAAYAVANTPPMAYPRYQSIRRQGQAHALLSGPRDQRARRLQSRSCAGHVPIGPDLNFRPA